VEEHVMLLIQDPNSEVQRRAYDLLYPVFVDWVARGGGFVEKFLVNLLNKALGLVAVMFPKFLVFLAF
jgi:hypothetical protein